MSRSPIIYRAFLESSYVQRFSDSQARRIIGSLRTLMVKKHHVFQSKLSGINLKHIFSPDISYSNNGGAKMKGFHLDQNKKLQKDGIFNVETDQSKGGVHESKFTLSGTDIKKKSTHFPAHWSYKKATKRILEVYHHPSSKIKPSAGRRGVYEIIGKTKGGVKIEVIYNSKSQKIETAYPSLKDDV